MTTLGRQFGGVGGIPRQRGGDRGGSRPPDVVSQHPDHGPVGSLSAIARELGLNPPALHMHRRRRADFPLPIIGSTYSLRSVAEFRAGHSEEDEEFLMGTGSHEYEV